MRPILTLLLLTLSSVAFSQSTRRIVKDLDGDLKKDTVYIDSDRKKIFCSLSTQRYKTTESRRIRILNFGNTLVSIKGGFEFWNNYGRSDFINEFRYDPKAKKMRLVKITRIEYNLRASNYNERLPENGGKSTINLLTNQYVGDFYDLHNGKIRKLPTIYSNLALPTTYLETFDDALYFYYEERCLELYEKSKKENL